MNPSIRTMALIVALMSLCAYPGASHSKIQLGDYVKSLKLGGDFRLRQETFNKKTPGQVDQSRQRFRLRLGLEVEMPNHWTVATRFASGTGEQQSAYQSFDNLSSQKQFWIDRAYIQWQPRSNWKISGGRMNNPFWRIYSNDAVWDDDFNPEGFGQSVEFMLPAGMRLFLHALQMVADEDAASNHDQWMFGEQAGLDMILRDGLRLKLAGAYYDWIFERKNSFGAAKANEGNRRTGTGILENEFGILEGTAELMAWVRGIPISFQGVTVKNIRAMDTLLPKEDNGYQAGVIVGKAKEAESWEVAYFNKYMRTDATVADIADSDFGDGGTNRKGHIGWLAYSPRNWMQIRAKYLVTQVIHEALAPGADDINRLQLDLAIQF